MSMSSSLTTAPREFYFAFGSNMHLEQMASRCPDSALQAIGILRGYRWQINQRGVANVVASSSASDTVFGIVFNVSQRDVKTLDRNEGVSKGFYEREMMPIEVQSFLLDELHGRKTVTAVDYLRGLEGPSRPSKSRSMEKANVDYTQQQMPPSRFFSSAAKPQTVRALVYLSHQYCKDGSIRAEYVLRMKLAMTDALKLGVDSSYLEHILLPIVSSTPQEPVQPKKISKAKSKPRSSSENLDEEGQRRKQRRSTDRRDEREERRRVEERESGSSGRGKRRSLEDGRRDTDQKGWFESWTGFRWS